MDNTVMASEFSLDEFLDESMMDSTGKYGLKDIQTYLYKERQEDRNSTLVSTMSGKKLLIELLISNLENSVPLPQEYFIPLVFLLSATDNFLRLYEKKETKYAPLFGMPPENILTQNNNLTLFEATRSQLADEFVRRFSHAHTDFESRLLTDKELINCLRQRGSESKQKLAILHYRNALHEVLDMHVKIQ